MTSAPRPSGRRRPVIPAARTAEPPRTAARPPRGGAADGRGAGSGTRDPFFDNAKYLALVLVAMGHAWEPLTDSSRTAGALYLTVYTFHMPAFVIVSGYFSRGFDARPDRVRRLVTGVAVPYVVFETGYSLFKRWADGDPSFGVSLLDPWYLTWFLVALFVWRLTTPLWRAVRHPVPLALLIASFAAVSPDLGDDLDLQRVLQFLPFFVLGLRLRPDHLDRLRRRAVRVAAVPVFAGALAVAYWARPRMARAWLYRRDSVQELGAPAWTGPVMTCALFGCSLLLAACFLAWVPRRRTWFTGLGAGTLYGYLLHGFLAKGSRFWGWYDACAWPREPLGEVAVTLVAAGWVTLLCTPVVRRAFRWAVEPRMAWAFTTGYAAGPAAVPGARRESGRGGSASRGRSAAAPGRR
ncbi:acyltransferase family protein [Streptomyces sp. B1866]|uniref:acyltransferase family protein n=1 Tax=Streptomyces sp. B1866 TaxID=3075431 RepID=UPI0028905E57|nr:acyltransferase family protein [Streptomyces sp. B1866]MDT3397195.1 acyltransferase family protein [Streptomyces sp. B1866]